MALVHRNWDHGTITVEEQWLERAKQLTREHGIVKTSLVASILEQEMMVPKYDEMVSILIVLAQRETTTERTFSQDA